MTYTTETIDKVKSLIASGLPISEAARANGVPRTTARHWVQKAVTASKPARNLLAEKLADDGELSRLRRENVLLRQLVATLLNEAA